LRTIGQWAATLAKGTVAARSGKAEADRACVADAFEQLGLAWADPRTGLEDDADRHPRHAALCHVRQRFFEARSATGRKQGLC
jgi:hypothetical protein